MGQKTFANQEAESDLFGVIDYEGGFYEAFLSHGIDLNQYPIDKDLATEIRDIAIKLKEIDKRVQSVMIQLEESADSVAYRLDGCGEQS